jgi:sigma-70-like protein
MGGAGDAVNARDREQFEEFMTSRWPGLVRLAFGLTGDRWLAEDLAQTALASAYASWWRVRRADDPDAYVRRILINASKSYVAFAIPPGGQVRQLKLFDSTGHVFAISTSVPLPR